jgi:hypothetical protein
MSLPDEISTSEQISNFPLPSTKQQLQAARLALLHGTGEIGVACVGVLTLVCR